MDSNHRSLRRRIYSPFPLTTRAPTHIMVTQEGLEPPTLWFVVKYSNPAELLSHVMAVCILSMVGPLGLEPRTDRLWAGCSNQLSYRPVSIDRKSRKAFILRELQTFMERKTRLELATPTLARWCSTNWAISALYGAENETRTRDPHLGKVMLYQLSYFRNLFFISAIQFNLTALTKNIIHFNKPFVNTFLIKIQLFY